MELLEEVLKTIYSLGREDVTADEEGYWFTIKETQFLASLKEKYNQDHLYLAVRLERIDPKEDLDKVLTMAELAARKVNDDQSIYFPLIELRGHFSFERYLPLTPVLGKPLSSEELNREMEEMIAFAHHDAVTKVNKTYRKP